MTQPAVTVYRKPDCVACDRTKLKLDKAGVEYTTVDIVADPGAYAYVTQVLGYSQAPVVVVNNGGEDEHWSGYQPPKIQELILNGGN